MYLDWCSSGKKTHNYKSFLQYLCNFFISLRCVCNLFLTECYIYFSITKNSRAPSGGFASYSSLNCLFTVTKPELTNYFHGSSIYINMQFWVMALSICDLVGREVCIYAMDSLTNRSRICMACQITPIFICHSGWAYYLRWCSSVPHIGDAQNVQQTSRSLFHNYIIITTIIVNNKGTFAYQDYQNLRLLLY